MERGAGVRGGGERRGRGLLSAVPHRLAAPRKPRERKAFGALQKGAGKAWRRGHGTRSEGPGAAVAREARGAWGWCASGVRLGTGPGLRGCPRPARDQGLSPASHLQTPPGHKHAESDGSALCPPRGPGRPQDGAGSGGRTGALRDGREDRRWYGARRGGKLADLPVTSSSGKGTSSSVPKPPRWSPPCDGFAPGGDPGSGAPREKALPATAPRHTSRRGDQGGPPAATRGTRGGGGSHTTLPRAPRKRLSLAPTRTPDAERDRRDSRGWPSEF